MSIIYHNVTKFWIKGSRIEVQSLINQSTFSRIFWIKHVGFSVLVYQISRYRVTVKKEAQILEAYKGNVCAIQRNRERERRKKKKRDKEKKKKEKLISVQVISSLPGNSISGRRCQIIRIIELYWEAVMSTHKITIQLLLFQLTNYHD